MKNDVDIYLSRIYILGYQLKGTLNIILNLMYNDYDLHKNIFFKFKAAIWIDMSILKKVYEVIICSLMIVKFENRTKIQKHKN